MKAVGYKDAGPIDRAESLVDIEIEKPSAKGRDLLVEVKAISINPVDTKVRRACRLKGSRGRFSVGMSRARWSRPARM